MVEDAQEKLSPFELRQIEAIIYYQLGIEVDLSDLAPKIRVVRSKQTGRIKQLLLEGKTLFSLRATDGFIVPSLEGWKFLVSRAKTENLLCVVVPQDIASFVAEGRTLFSKHVIKANENIAPGDEVCIMTETGDVVAQGKAMLPGREMGLIKIGKAVKTR